MIEYWSWWKGALALGGLTVFFVLMIGRMMGVSGSWANIVNWRESRNKQKTASAFQTNAPVMQNALLAATLAEFGEEATRKMFAGQGVALPTQSGTHASVTGGIRWTAHLTFLLFMTVGGFLASLASGHLELHLDLGAVHTQLFGTGLHEWLMLLGGGILVGFGTQMGGGCTSGHGLSGVSRLTPSSLVATAMFFASAVATSFIVEAFVK
jgi:uncharacterized membrane protein YedE/YeeE